MEKNFPQTNNSNNNSKSKNKLSSAALDNDKNPFCDAIAPYLTNITMGNDERYYLIDAANDTIHPLMDCSLIESGHEISGPIRIVDRHYPVTNFLVSLDQVSKKNFSLNSNSKKHKLKHLSGDELTIEELQSEQYCYLQQVISHIKMGSFAINQGGTIYRIDTVIHPHYPYARLGDQLFLFLQHAVYIQTPTAGDIIWSNMSNETLSLAQYEDPSFYGTGTLTPKTIIVSCSKQVLLYFIERMRRLMIGAYHKFSKNKNLIQTMKDVLTNRFSLMNDNSIDDEDDDDDSDSGDENESNDKRRRVGVYAIDFDLYEDDHSFQISRKTRRVLKLSTIPKLPIHACASGIHQENARIFSFLSCYGDGFYDNKFIKKLRKISVESLSATDSNTARRTNQSPSTMSTIPVDKNLGGFFSVLAIVKELQNHYNVPASKMDITALTYISNCPTCEEFLNDICISKIPQKIFDATYAIFGKKVMLLFLKILSGFNAEQSEIKREQIIKPLVDYNGYFDVRKDIQGGEKYPLPLDNRKARVQKEKRIAIEKPTTTMTEPLDCISFVSSHDQQFFCSDPSEYRDILILQEHVNYTFSLACFSYLPKLYFNSILKLLKFWFGDEEEKLEAQKLREDKEEEEEEEEEEEKCDEDNNSDVNNDDDEDGNEQSLCKKKKLLPHHKNIANEDNKDEDQSIALDVEEKQYSSQEHHPVTLNHLFCVFLIALFYNRASALQDLSFQKFLEFLRGCSQVGKSLFCDILEESTSPQFRHNLKIGVNDGFDGQFSPLTIHNIFEEFSKINSKMAGQVKSVINNSSVISKKVKFKVPAPLKAFFFLANSNELAFTAKQPRETSQAIINRISPYWNINKTRQQVINFQQENVSWFKNTSVLQKHFMSVYTRFFMFTVKLPSEHYDSSRFREYFPKQMRELAEELKVEDNYVFNVESMKKNSFSSTPLKNSTNSLLLTPSANKIELIAPAHSITFPYFWLYIKYFRNLLQEDQQKQIDQIIIPSNINISSIENDFQNDKYGLDIFQAFFSNKKHYNACHGVLPIFPQCAFINGFYDHSILQKIVQGETVFASIKDANKKNQYQCLSWSCAQSLSMSSSSSSSFDPLVRRVEVKTVREFLFHIICALNYLYNIQPEQTIELDNIKLSPTIEELLSLGLLPDGTFHFNSAELMECYNKLSYLFDVKLSSTKLSEQFDAIFLGKLSLIETKKRIRRVVYNVIDDHYNNSNDSQLKRFTPAAQNQQYSSHAIEFNQNLINNSSSSNSNSKSVVETLFDLFFSKFAYANGKKIKLVICAPAKDNCTDTDDRDEDNDGDKVSTDVSDNNNNNNNNNNERQPFDYLCDAADSEERRALDRDDAYDSDEQQLIGAEQQLITKNNKECQNRNNNEDYRYDNDGGDESNDDRFNENITPFSSPASSYPRYSILSVPQGPSGKKRVFPPSQKSSPTDATTTKKKRLTSLRNK